MTLDYYASPVPMTDLGECAAAALSDDVAELVRTVQSWVVHPFHAHLYGVDPGDDGERQLQHRSVRCTRSTTRFAYRAGS
jgi:hypothetical protein